MDEPTAALNDAEVEVLHELIRRFIGPDTGVIYISHRMDELRRIAQRITVIRDGRYIGTRETAGTTMQEVIAMMVGRELTLGARPEGVREDRETVLEVEGLATKDLLEDVSFELRRGEILGFAGLMGAGRTEVARAIVGADRMSAGTLRLRGREVRIHTPAEAARHRIGYLSEDRKQFGLLLEQDVNANIGLSALSERFQRWGFVSDGAMRGASREYVDTLRIKTPSVSQTAKNLSGGNQQKVVIAKWLVKDCDILIFDEPTRGIDVGAKEEIYRLAQRARRLRQVDHHDLLRAARDPAHVAPDRGHERGPRDRHAGRRGGHAGERHALRDAAREGGRGMTASSLERPKTRVQAVGTGLRDRLQQFLAFASLITIFLFFSIASSSFLNYANVTSILFSTVVIGLLALGTTFVIITSGIDLSIGTGMTLCAVISGVLIVNSGLPVWLGVIGTILFGGLIGFVNGFNVSFLGIPPFIATLAMMLAAQGLALVISDSTPIYFNDAPGYTSISTGHLFGVDFPNAVLVLAVATVIAAVVLNKTVLGRYTYSIGSNEEATALSGIERAPLEAPHLHARGLLHRPGGRDDLGPAGLGPARHGLGYELQAIAAVVIGGTSLAGGKGSIVGTHHRRADHLRPQQRAPDHVDPAGMAERDPRRGDPRRGLRRHGAQAHDVSEGERDAQQQVARPFVATGLALSVAACGSDDEGSSAGSASAGGGGGGSSPTSRSSPRASSTSSGRRSSRAPKRRPRPRAHASPSRARRPSRTSSSRSRCSPTRSRRSRRRSASRRWTPRPARR